MSQIKEIAAYWGTRAQGYSERCKIDLIEDTKFDWLDKICKYAPAKQQLNVLDIGCGAGFFSILMTKAGHNVTSIDYTENMVNSAIQNAMDAGVDIEVLQMDAQNLDFEDDTFDLIVTRNVTWVMEQPTKAYSEWIRVLQPGGRMINFDENQYLYLFDEDYKKEKERRGEPEYMKKVHNTQIMEELAYKLPLSKEVRPCWDVQTLLSLGVSNVTADVYNKRVIEKDGKNKVLYNSFIVCAEK